MTTKVALVLIYRDKIMSKASLSTQALSPPCRDLLAKLGGDLAIARKRRRIPLRDMAARMSTSVNTLQRLERGDPGVGLGVLLSALWALQLHERVGALLDPDSDAIGKAREIERLPKRIRRTADEDLDF